MSNARFFSAIALTAIITATLVGGLTLSRSALAEPSRTAECSTGLFPAAKQAEWMNAELAAGRSQFVSTSNGVLTCAW